MNNYSKAKIQKNDVKMFQKNELPIFVAAIGWVIIVFGSAWAFCVANCGWNSSNVHSCEAGWFQVKSVCKR